MADWYVCKEGDVFSIRKTISANGKRRQVRYPAKKYVHVRSDYKELRDFVIRLNGKDPRVERIKARLEFTHAWIGPDLIDEYREVYLKNYIPDEKAARVNVTYLKKYALNFFIQNLQLANPEDWHRQQYKWGLALLGESREVKIVKKPLSAFVLRKTVYELNRFMRFVHSKKPDVPSLVFEPLSKSRLKEYEARRRMSGKIKSAKYVTPADWKTLNKNLPTGWGDVIRLSYFYGLRRNEAYALSHQQLRTGYLNVTKQVERLQNGKRIYKPLKGRYERKVPHWFIEPKTTYSTIDRITSVEVHPDTITDKFAELCLNLKLPRYTVHDLRRSFITNAVKAGKTPEDVRLAVGHVDGTTTYKYYVQDSRTMEDDLFVPED